MRSVHVLADLYGPRLTGSPSLKAAGEWAIATMQSWGLTNGRLEPWNWGRDGWVNERFSAHIVSPVKDSLVGEVLAWTPGTNGIVTAQAFHLRIPERPTAGAVDDVSEQRSGSGARPDRARRPDHDAAGRPESAPRARGRRRRCAGGSVLLGQDPADRPRSRRSDQSNEPPPPMSSAVINRRIDEFLLSRNGARIRVDDARRPHGQVTAFNNPAYDISTVVPSVILRNEDYGRIARLLADGTPVELEFTDRQPHLSRRPDGVQRRSRRFAGTDKQDEVVIIGGHLDSWQSATGATDNAVGCAVMMEAARILRAIGVQPRRTIRVALWSGEEQGLLGVAGAISQQHFGTLREPEGRVRQADGVPEPRPRHRAVRAARSSSARTRRPRSSARCSHRSPTSGSSGAAATRSRAFGTTDHTAFNNAGLTGIDFELDPIEYDSHTHHTNLDTYERILEGRRAGRGDHRRVHRLPARHARRDAAAFPAHRDASRTS